MILKILTFLVFVFCEGHHTLQGLRRKEDSDSFRGRQRTGNHFRRKKRVKRLNESVRILGLWCVRMVGRGLSNHRPKRVDHLSVSTPHKLCGARQFASHQRDVVQRRKKWRRKPTTHHAGRMQRVRIVFVHLSHLLCFPKQFEWPSEDQCAFLLQSFCGRNSHSMRTQWRPRW